MELQRITIWLITALILTLFIATASAYNLTIYAKDSETGNDISSFYAKLDDELKSTSSGEITFENVSGSYQLEVWAENYAVSKYSLEVNSDMIITAYLTPLESSWVVSFKVYRCFKPVVNVPVKVSYNGNVTNSGYTDDTGSIAFNLDKTKTYVIDVNNSEKVVTIQPVENNYVITLPCNITMEGETATYNQTFGNYTWDLLKIGQDISSQLSPSARGFLSGILAWLLMYGTSSLGLTSPVPGIIALAGLAVVGFTDWIVVLLCAVFSAGMYIIRRNLS